MYNERKARIKYHDEAFLNPSAMFLRDLSVAFIQSFAKKDTMILDPTSATGIRAIRFSLETKSKAITALDINKSVAKIAQRNVKFNKAKVKVLSQSIQEFANTTKERFSVIDLDPFGGSAPYIYDLMKILSDGGYLLVTATDTAVLCGAHEKACIKIYDAKPLHNELCQEAGVRILIGFIARVAAQFNYGIEVLFSLSHLHYMKVFIKVKHGAEVSTQSIKNLGYAHYCSKCGFRSLERGFFPNKTNCELCSSKLIIAGKLWAGRIQDKATLKIMLDYLIKNKMDKSEIKTISTIYNEPDAPLYYSISKLTKMLGVTSVSPALVIERLKKKGFEAERTNFDNYSVKTDATIKDLKGTITEKK